MSDGVFTDAMHRAAKYLNVTSLMGAKSDSAEVSNLLTPTIAPTPSNGGDNSADLSAGGVVGIVLALLFVTAIIIYLVAFNQRVREMLWPGAENRNGSKISTYVDFFCYHDWFSRVSLFKEDNPTNPSDGAVEMQPFEKTSNDRRSSSFTDSFDVGVEGDERGSAFFGRGRSTVFDEHEASYQTDANGHSAPTTTTTPRTRSIFSLMFFGGRRDSSANYADKIAEIKAEYEKDIARLKQDTEQQHADEKKALEARLKQKRITREQELVMAGKQTHEVTKVLANEHRQEIDALQRKFTISYQKSLANVKSCYKFDAETGDVVAFDEEAKRRSEKKTRGKSFTSGHGSGVLDANSSAASSVVVENPAARPSLARRISSAFGFIDDALEGDSPSEQRRPSSTSRRRSAATSPSQQWQEGEGEVEGNGNGNDVRRKSRRGSTLVVDSNPMAHSSQRRPSSRPSSPASLAASSTGAPVDRRVSGAALNAERRGTTQFVVIDPTTSFSSPRRLSGRPASPASLDRRVSGADLVADRRPSSRGPNERQSSIAGSGTGSGADRRPSSRPSTPGSGGGGGGGGG